MDIKKKKNIVEILDEQAKKPPGKYPTIKQKKKEETKKEEPKIKEIQDSFYVNEDGILIEQIYDKTTGKSRFLKLNGKTIEEIPDYLLDINVKLVPIQGEELKLGVILLPSQVGYYKDIPSLIEEIKDFIGTYLDIDEIYLQFAAWYVLLTWVYDKFTTINYLRALGDTGCGKSRFLNVIGGLCYKAIRGSGAVTVASIKRITQKWKGTMVIDEGDFKESDEKSELIKYFNLGFEKDSAMMNCDKNDPSKLEFFVPFGPKIIATRKSFSDKALEARCLTHVMQQTKRKDLPILLLDKFYKEQEELRNKLLYFRFEMYFKIKPLDEFTFDESGISLEPRLKQSTYAFASLFADNKKALKAFNTFIKNYQVELIEERAASFDGSIVNALYNLIDDSEMDYPIISSADIVEVMKDDYKEVKPAVIGRHLKSLGIETIQKKVEKKVKRIIPLKRNLLDLFERYISTGTSEKVVSAVSAKTVVAVDGHKQIFINNGYGKGGGSTDTIDSADTVDTSKLTSYTKETGVNEGREHSINVQEEEVKDDVEEEVKDDKKDEWIS